MARFSDRREADAINEEKQIASISLVFERWLSMARKTKSLSNRLRKLLNFKNHTILEISLTVWNDRSDISKRDTRWNIRAIRIHSVKTLSSAFYLWLALSKHTKWIKVLILSIYS